MIAQILRTLVFAAVMSLSLACNATADEKQTESLTQSVYQSPAGAISILQKAHTSDAHTFVVQDELESVIRTGGGGACASAAGIDVLQTLRVMAGLDKLANPHQAVFASFADQDELLDGRVTNDQFVQLIKFYETHLDGIRLSVDVESSPDSAYSTSERAWSASKGPDLSVMPKQLKVLSYTVTETNGDVPGRHFVLLKDHSASKLTVVDPTKPTKDYRYLVDFKSSKQGSFQKLFLLNEPGFSRYRNRTFELNTIFRIAMLDEDDAINKAKNGSVSVEHIKRIINQTASDFRDTKDYLSPLAWRKKTADYGLPGLDLPVEYGGSSWPASKMLEVFKHAGRYNLNLRDVVGGAHVRPLLKSAHPEVLDIVRQVARGRGYIAIAITEPTAGSDVTSIKSTSRKVDGGYLLTGTKRFNARLIQATHVILFTQGTTGEQGKLSVFVVPINTPGLKIERLSAHGLTGNSYGGVSFNNLFVPDSHLIGKDGASLGLFFEHFLYWRLMQTAAALGTAENALEQMAERIKTREAFGGPIGRFTHLQQPIGQHSTELRMAHSLAQEAARLIDAGDYKSARVLINGLKAEGVEIALRAVDAATRAFGGEGYSNLVDLGDRLRDLNGLRIADGTTDVMRMDVVRQSFGEEFWEMAIQKDD